MLMAPPHSSSLIRTGFFFLGPLPEEKGITERVSKNTVDVDAEIVCLGAFQLLMSLRGLSPFLSRSSENEFIKSNFIGSPGGFVSCSFVGIPGFSFSDIGSGVGDRKETSWRCASIWIMNLSAAITGGKSRVARAPAQQHQHRCTMRVHADSELKTDIVALPCGMKRDSRIKAWWATWRRTLPVERENGRFIDVAGTRIHFNDVKMAYFSPALRFLSRLVLWPARARRQPCESRPVNRRREKKSTSLLCLCVNSFVRFLLALGLCDWEKFNSCSFLVFTMCLLLTRFISVGNEHCICGTVEWCCHNGSWDC